MTTTATQPAAAAPTDDAPMDPDGSPQPPTSVAGEPAEPTAQGAGSAPGDKEDQAPGDGKATKPGDEADESKEPEDKRTVQEIAQDYLIPISDGAVKEWEAHPEAYLPYAIETATGLYPTFAAQLKQGLTTQTLVDPYEQVAMQLLGPGTKIDWTDPKWEKALDGGTSSSGGPAPMPLSAWRDLLRSDPSYGYDKSPQSHAVADNLAQTINDGFSGKTPLPPPGTVPAQTSTPPPPALPTNEAPQ